MKSIREYWDYFGAENFKGKVVSAVLYDEMIKSFYAGFGCALSRITTIAKLPEDEGVIQLERLGQEFKQFVLEINLKGADGPHRN